MPKKHVKRHVVDQPLDADYRLIPLTKNQNAIVDAADFDWLNQWNWFAYWAPHTESFYARRSEKRNIISMADEILHCEQGQCSDHKNHDTLDNRKGNLRKALIWQNTANQGLRSSNRSGYIGVWLNKRHTKWESTIGYNKTRIYLGCFSSAKEAARARDKAAKKYHGEFAHLNFPDQLYAPKTVD